MKTKQIPIEEPCHQDWEQLRGDERRRFCSQCDKHVHNLSAMTKAQAQALLEREPKLCVIYKYDEHDELVFEPEPTRDQLQLQGARKLLAAAALAVPMLLAACDEPAPPQALPVATSPIRIEEGGARLAPPASLALEATSTQGASRAPAPPQPQPTTQAKPELLENMGQAVAQLPSPDEEQELKKEQEVEEISCDKAAQAKPSDELKSQRPPLLERQVPQERLQDKTLKKTMGPMVKMGNIKAH